MTLQRDALRAFAPFDRLSDEYLGKVLEKAQYSEIPRGTLIFKRGKTLESQYYLLSGRVDLIDAQFEKRPLEAGSEEARFPLADHSPTQVSAVAMSDVTLVALERDFLDLVMVWSQSGDHPDSEAGDGEHDWMSYLLESPLFTRIPPSHIQQLFVRFEEVEAKEGEWVVREGEPGDYFYVLESGRAKVTNKTGKVLAELGAGSYFGEEALAGDTTRNANVQMMSTGRLMRLEKADFKTLLQEPVIQTIAAADWLERRAQLQPDVLDVRLVVERRFGKIEGSRSLPLAQLRDTLEQLDRDRAYVVADDAGRRSHVAVQLLAQSGLEVYLLEGAAEHYGTAG